MAMAVILTAASANAAVMTSSTTQPTVDGEDIVSFGTPTGADKWWPGEATDYGNPGKTIGQTFTTGSGDVLLYAFTFQIRHHAEPTKEYTIRVGTVLGSTFTEIASESATQSFATAADDYWTWTLDSPVPLSANTVYGVDVGLNSSTSAWQTGIPYAYFTDDVYPYATRFRSGTAGNGVGDETVSQMSGERVFHIDLDLVYPYPANGAAVPAGDVELKWTNMDPCTPPVYVDVWFGTDPNDLTGVYYTKVVDAGANTTSVTVSASVVDTYYWQVNSYLDGSPTGDPVEGELLSFYVLDASAVGALTALKNHILHNPALSPEEIAAHKATIDENKLLFGNDYDVMAAGFDLVETYDNTPGYGPLWINQGNFSRSSAPDDIHWTMYWVMQYIMDYTYTAVNISSHESLIDGFKFESSAYFPGEADPPADPEATHTVSIDGTYLDMWGHEIMHEERPARKPTGTYLAPGTIATVTVPSSIVGKGYEVRVGAHSWDHSNKPTCKRLDRVSLVYSIDSTQVKVASPLGGGIYIEVSEGQDTGIVSIQIKNAIRSPYFSAKSFHTTTLLEWRDTERHHPGPWADFQSEKFMMNVPSDWIYNFDDPVTMMADWDTATDALNDLMGYPSRTRETMYPQVDVQNRSSVLAPGYPSCNASYNPNASYGGDHNHYLLNGPRVTTAPDFLFHEEGHGYLFVKFPGEMESTVNLLHVPVYHDKFGYDLDYAFASSRGFQGNPNRTLDNTAVTWMTVFNFSPKEEPMAEAEKAYQLKGHAKFVDIAKLFGWEAVNAFWYSINVDYENGINWSRHGSNIDDLILRWSESVGVDLRPLFHFWGTHPQNPSALEAAIAAENLPASAAIYDRLVHYKSLVPADNQAFQAFALNWWGHQPSINGYWTEREHARQWDNTVLWDPPAVPNEGEIYDETSCARIKAVIDGLLDLYFPDGPPLYSVDAGDDMITWSAQAVPLDPNVVNNTDPYAALTYAWTADPVAGVVFNPPAANVEAPTVTITKATDNPSTVTLTLAVHDGIHPTVQDTMTIDVYDDACLAARIGLGLAADNPTDLDGNCITDLKDLAEMLAKWLDDHALTAPVPK